MENKKGKEESKEGDANFRWEIEDGSHDDLEKVKLDPIIPPH
jgi:hypothetical protein